MNDLPLHFLSLKSADVLPYLDAIGSLRLRVFREYPYLYEGTAEDERQYLTTYVQAPSSLVILAMSGEDVIGASTCIAMGEADAAFRACFEESSLDPQDICYLGESVLLSSYRGRGIGKTFFQMRLEHARHLGAKTAAFCAVDRPSNHPLRPADYRPLDGFWESLGFIRHKELQAEFVWKDVGQPQETPKTLTFWLKSLVKS